MKTELDPDQDFSRNSKFSKQDWPNFFRWTTEGGLEDGEDLGPRTDGGDDKWGYVIG